VRVYEHGEVLHGKPEDDEKEVLFVLACEACYKRGNITYMEAEEITVNDECLVRIADEAFSVLILMTQGYKFPLPGRDKDWILFHEDTASEGQLYRTVGLQIKYGGVSTTLRFIKVPDARIMALLSELTAPARSV